MRPLGEPYQEGDWLWWTCADPDYKGPPKAFAVAPDEFGDIDARSESEVWLPRQDQLQEMVFAEDIGLGDVGYILHQLSQFEAKGGYNASSMEQFCLAYVMWRNYGKRWTGGEWC